MDITRSQTEIETWSPQFQAHLQRESPKLVQALLRQAQERRAEELLWQIRKGPQS